MRRMEMVMPHDATVEAVGDAAEGYWSKQRAAKYLGVAPHSLDYLVRTRQLAFFLIAGKRRFRKKDLDEYAQQQYSAAAVSTESG